MADPAYQIVVGLEVHVQLLTRTKLFCGCSTKFGQPPNTATCPVCMGLPGALPVMNRLAFDLALRAALALDCQIARFTKWDRKNYFYPDLPKNYQISQYDLPFSTEGHLDIDAGAGPRRIGLFRVHLEEDAGKMLHFTSPGGERATGQDTLIDLNRTGTPLLEIVGKPEIHSPEEARVFVEELRLLLREIGVSDCEMQEGSLRCDANVNIHVPKPGGPDATPIVEVKNLNSIKAIEKAVRYEAQRQYAEYQANPGYRLGTWPKSTWGWDDEREVTWEQRRKEESADYRYFPDPDLVPVVVDDAWLERVRGEMGERPAAQRARLLSQYGLSEYDVGILTTRGRAVVAYFEETARACGDAKAACNWVTNQVQTTLNATGGDISTFPVPAGALGGLIVAQRIQGLNHKVALEVYARMLAAGVSAEAAIADLGIAAAADEGTVREVVRRGLAANAPAVADYKAGKVQAANRIKGFVMKETKGTARADLVERILKEELDRA